MGILDEIEGHATHAVRTQARSGKAEAEAKAYADFANRRSGILVTIATVSAFIPFVGWAISMWCFVFMFEYIRTLNPGQAGAGAAVPAFAWGVLTWLITWATFALGYHSAEGIEMVIFYVIAAICVYFTFTARAHAVKVAKVTREAADYLTEQQG